MKSVFIFIALLQIPLRLAHAGSSTLNTESRIESCEELLSLSSTQTTTLLAYLQELFERQLIGMKQIQTLIREIERGRMINLIDENDVVASSTAFIHHESLNHLIRNSHLNLAPIKRWAVKALESSQNDHLKRKETQKETTDFSSRITFHPIPAGSFQMGEEGRQVPVTLSHNIAVMPIPVTQAQWVTRMGWNPAKFNTGEWAIKGKNGVTMQPFHPIEGLTWWSALVFANEISKEHGLEAAYDLSGLKFKGSAKHGTLRAVSGQLKINAPDGDIYRARGFRLPTDAEAEYLLREAGKNHGKWAFGEDEQSHEKNVSRYAWHWKNARGMTQSAGELAPMIINGFAFYDLYGNVSEWTHDFQAEEVFDPLAGLDPHTTVTTVEAEMTIIRRGCAWSNSAEGMRCGRRGLNSANARSEDTGFRLVRTLNP